MALMELTFRSEALNSDQTVTVFLPEPKDPMEMKAVFGTENPKDLEGTEFDLYHG